MRIAIISPHRDDAAFSCGALLWAARSGPSTLSIVNIYTCSAYAPYIAEHGRDAATVTKIRRKEDEAFRRVLEAAGTSVRMHDLRRSDAPLRLHLEDASVLDEPLCPEDRMSEACDLARDLAPLLSYDLVLAPLALGGHVDHCIAKEAATRLLLHGCLGFYEDVPYVCCMTEQQRAEEVRGALPAQSDVDPYVLRASGAAHHKECFSRLYPSQIAAEVASEIGLYAAKLHDGERLWLPPLAARMLQSDLQGRATLDVAREA